MTKEEVKHNRGSAGRVKPDNTVFYISLVLVIGLSIWAIVSSDSFGAAANSIYAFLTTNFAWLYMLVMTSYVVFCVIIAMSRWGGVKMGASDSKPEYGNVSWFGMMFSAGMGVGLVFWGVAEPLTYWTAPPDVEPATVEAASFAFRKAFLHWGLHPWAGYAVLGMALAYFVYRKGRPNLMSSVLTPFLGEKSDSHWLGKTVDVLATFATAGGIGTSLGLGAMQINAGLNAVFGIPQNNTVIIIIVAIITVLYTWTAVAGVDNGIKRVCDTNIALAFAIMLVCLCVGPTVDILQNLVEGLGNYVMTFAQSSLEMGAFSENPSWYQSWTVFYWAWWIAWAPFVGGFVARISKGRTVREFVAGVMLMPAGASFIWFAIFGTMGINVGELVGLEAAKQIVSDTSLALFTVLNYYPLGNILAVVILVNLITFFVTSANSATFVLGSLTTNGEMNPPKSRLMLWGVLQAVFVLAMLVSTDDGLKMMQTLSLVPSFPFAFVLVAAMIGIVKTFKEEDVLGSPELPSPSGGGDAAADAVAAPSAAAAIEGQVETPPAAG